MDSLCKFLLIFILSFSMSSMGMDAGFGENLDDRIFLIHLTDVLPIPRLLNGGLNATVPTAIFTKDAGKIVGSHVNPKSIKSPPLRPTIHWTFLGKKADCFRGEFLGDDVVEQEPSDISSRQYGVLENVRNLKKRAVFGGNPGDTFTVGEYTPSHSAIIFAPDYKKKEIKRLLRQVKDFPAGIIFYSYADNFTATDAIEKYANEQNLPRIISDDYFINDYNN